MFMLLLTRSSSYYYAVAFVDMEHSSMVQNVTIQIHSIPSYPSIPICGFFPFFFYIQRPQRGTGIEWLHKKTP